MPLPLEDYALIGDTQTAALVGRDGSIDWLCLPRFDSPACFAALLGDESHGRWLVAPAGGVRRVERRYRPGTLVLETDFHTDDGVLQVVDSMPVRDEAPDVVRVARCLRGRVAVRMELVLRFDFGHVVPWVRRYKDEGLVAIAGPEAVHLIPGRPVRGEDLTTVAEFELDEGDEVAFVLTWFPSHEAVPQSVDGIAATEDTTQWWHEWSDRCEVSDLVRRSLITLKALTYAPTGGIVAAPTTSLPEEIGGARNWDYRFCWLRDATFTLYSLLMAGYDDEAEAWREWLLRAVAGDPRDLRIMYGIRGERRIPEVPVEWLPGYEGSLPVRVGNDASRQFQLDVYGEILDLLHQASREGLPHESAAWEMELRIMDVLESNWRDPDEGIWEVRGGRQQFVHSKVMAWVGVDRAVRSVELFGFDGPVDRWRALRDEIHDEICREGYDDDLGTFTQVYGSKSLDAALLMMPLLGFLPATDERVAGTVAAIQDRLMVDGFVRRYDTSTHIDGLPGSEGAFIPCTCWLADCLALQGREDEARELFELVLDVRNDVGLLSEEYDPVRRRMVGNFPQAFSHVSVIGTARNLSRGEVGPADRRRRPIAVGLRARTGRGRR